MRKLFDLIVLLALLGAADAASASAQAAPSGAGVRVAELVSPSVVLVLTGKGAGRLESTGTGVVVRADGVLLTAYHLVKDAREVQVRLRNGEVYDKVELVAFDERRDVAALRIPAAGLTALPRADGAEAKVGQRVFVVSNPQGLAWSVSDGLLSGVRLSDDVPGAGSGYQLLQHTAPVGGGSSGGALVDERGFALGILTASAGGAAHFAVPLASVAGLADSPGRTPLGAGTELRPQQPERAPSAGAVLKTDPAEILRAARIVYVGSNTSFFEAVQLQNELRKQADFVAWQMAIVDGWDGHKVADIAVEIDRPLFTYTFTYKLTDRRTSVVLAAGKITAWDGDAAAPKLAKRIVEAIKKVRQPPAAAGKKQASKDGRAAQVKN